TPTSPKGAVAFWGSSYSGTSTRWNNCMDYGIYRAVFDQGIQTCGPAMYSGKLAQLENFPLPEDSFDLRLYFHVYNLLGDPSLEMWTGVPRTLAVTYPGSIPVGASSFEVEVRDGTSIPVTGASVSLLGPGQVHLVRRTGASGRARFALPSTVADSLLVTVSGPNLMPHLGRVQVVSSPVFVGCLEHNPTEARPGNVNLSITLKNFGTSQTATGVRVLLRALDDAAVVLDSVRDYGNIEPGNSANAAPFLLVVAASCTSRQVIPLGLSVTSGSNTWESGLELVVIAPTLTTRGYTVHDANGILDPGESAELSVRVRNTGSATASGLVGVLRSLNPAAVAVLDSTGSFGDLLPGDSVLNTGDRFAVRAAGAIGIGRAFSLRLVLSSGSVEQVRDFVVTVGRPTERSPLGPDHYGYYAYDDIDVGYAERPDFNWVEIDPAHGGSGTRVNLANDTSVPVQLPFAFRFYGQEYGTVSVCDNGYLAMGSTWLGDAYNWSIPSPMGPDGMVAAFWDDFRTDTMDASGVYCWHDASSHRFVVEWSRCVHVHGFRPPYPAEQQTFQILLYDPQYYLTKTGDGPIVVQYLVVRDDDTLWGNNHNYATVGIQNPGHNDGLECAFAGSRPAAAAPVVPTRAIRFTTNPPDTFTAVGEQQTANSHEPVSITPNPCRGFTTLRLSPRIAGSSVPALSVFDASGRLVRQFAFDHRTSSFHVDLRTMPAGVYCPVLTNQTTRRRLWSTQIVVLD
ncbi:MAG: C25 family cysteine peptidase, partial [candidate division WOR-3 bacterium]